MKVKYRRKLLFLEALKIVESLLLYRGKEMIHSEIINYLIPQVAPSD